MIEKTGSLTFLITIHKRIAHVTQSNYFYIKIYMRKSILQVNCRIELTSYLSNSVNRGNELY